MGQTGQMKRQEGALGPGVGSPVHGLDGRGGGGKYGLGHKKSRQ
jgi:hypothetical protein